MKRPSSEAGAAKDSPFRRDYASTIASLFDAADAARRGLSLDDFAEALERSVRGHFGDAPTPSRDDVERYVRSLRIADLALAAACERGIAEAWEHFVLEYRPVLFRAARALFRDESRSRELADSLWADLYGLVERDGGRRSRLSYFHGRSSLAGWLRALVAQRHVDTLRAERRTDSLDADPVPIPDTGAPAIDGADPKRRRYLTIVREVLLAVLGGLEARERLRLSLYHLRGLTLAETGKILGEHESSASRKLDRTRRTIRKEVERRLRRDHGFDAAQIALCYEVAVTDWPDDLARSFSKARKPDENVPAMAREPG